MENFDPLERAIGRGLGIEVLLRAILPDLVALLPNAGTTLDAAERSLEEAFDSNVPGGQGAREAAFQMLSHIRASLPS